MEQETSNFSLETIVKIFTSIAEGGTTGNIIKGALLLAVAIGFFFFRRWLRKKEIEAAQRRNAQRRDQNQTTTDKQAQTINDDAKTSEDKIEDLLE